MKGCGIVLLVFAVLNLIVAFIAIASNAPNEAVGSKFSAFFLLGAIGGLLYYFGSQKKNK